MLAQWRSEIFHQSRCVVRLSFQVPFDVIFKLRMTATAVIGITKHAASRRTFCHIVASRSKVLVNYAIRIGGMSRHPHQRTHLWTGAIERQCESEIEAVGIYSTQLLLNL